MIAGRRHFVSAGNRPKRHSPGGGIPPGYIAESAETGYNHLKSRYYSSEVGRFLNAYSVDVLDEDQNNVLENNLFAYCLNNPVNMVDYDGNSAVAIAGGYGLYVWAFAGANAWNIIGQVVLVGMAV